MQSVVMVRFFCVLSLFFLPTPLFADTVWEIPEREVDILIDGFLDEWDGVPAMVLEPDGSDVQSKKGLGIAGTLIFAYMLRPALTGIGGHN